MSSRVIAIGDIHGCAAAISAMTRLIAPTSDDTIITLGDYVNRGPDSRGVLSQLIALQDRCTLIPLLGNHDDLLLHNRATRTKHRGMPSVDPETGLELFDESHFEFLQNCRTHYETETHFFVHANYDPDYPLEVQERYVLLWQHLHTELPGPHTSGRMAIVGHTSQRSGEIFRLPHLTCLDTYCHGGGWLTAMDVVTGDVWQVDREGTPRPGNG